MTLPKHIAIVMDGNGRWARQRGLPRVAGHRAGANTVREIIKSCAKKKIEVLTLFAFSVENWQRPVTEVKVLMGLLLKALQKEAKELHANNVCLKIIGDVSKLNKKLQENVISAEQLTANNTGLRLNIAINYSGRWDIVEAAKKIATDVGANKLNPTTINETMFQAALSLADVPEPDLFIRTSGEKRISNFMLWQLAYAELYFTDVLWPDFGETALEEALATYAKRERRFGKITTK